MPLFLISSEEAEKVKIYCQIIENSTRSYITIKKHHPKKGYHKINIFIANKKDCPKLFSQLKNIKRICFYWANNVLHYIKDIDTPNKKIYLVRDQIFGNDTFSNFKKELRLKKEKLKVSETKEKNFFNLPKEGIINNFFKDPKVIKELSKIEKFLREEEKNGATVYPPRDKIFNALLHFPLEKTKVIIIGQDPYHGPGQAMGLCFSVPKGIPIPPSLKNIFKELIDDGFKVDKNNGDLTPWADQDVLLLNTVFTVRKGEADSHRTVWSDFSTMLFSFLGEFFLRVPEKERPICILWGNPAQKIGSLFKECIHIKSAHPSFLSASRGFFGSKPFSRANIFLGYQKREPINWSLA